jgi:uncharacterized protein involved in exopolysaccharide biosynthesis
MSDTMTPASTPEPAQEIDLIELLRTLRRGIWVIVATASVFAGMAIAYGWVAQDWYKAEVVLAPTDDKSTPGGLAQLGGLASLAGINIGSTGSSQTAIAVLQSRDFARQIIEEQKLLTVVLAHEWDSKNNRWKSTDPRNQPDIRDAVDYFEKEIRNVNENKKTGLVTLTIHWTDPEQAAEWANLLVGKVNERMRMDALRESEARLTYLRSELNAADLDSMQTAIAAVIETEMQKMLLVRGNEEFAFKVVDRATPPRKPDRPKRLLLAFTSLMAGIASGIIFVLTLGRLKGRIRD